ncbi:MAG: polyphosphate polymerase domain-containing protein [Clostridiales bacterium]|nr:polyphosphate polymerase domain-containing protein [Clostridiales bacterium]
MTYINTFERYEIKYILTREQRKALCDLMVGKMKIDKYGHTTIRNIYYDTEDYRLIRNSLDKPIYKEKLRVRSYGRITKTDDVFIELKKKYESIVYKRRIALPEYITTDWLVKGKIQPVNSQIADEIEYFKNYYEGLKPAVFLSYEREAYYPTEPGDLRVTLDSNLIARNYDLTLLNGVYGENIIDRDLTVLEVKVSGAMPTWLIRFLNDNGIRKTSFSKYGMYYMNKMTPKSEDENEKGGLLYA